MSSKRRNRERVCLVCDVVTVGGVCPSCGLGIPAGAERWPAKHHYGSSHRYEPAEDAGYGSYQDVAKRARDRSNN